MKTENDARILIAGYCALSLVIFSFVVFNLQRSSAWFMLMVFLDLHFVGYMHRSLGIGINVEKFNSKEYEAHLETNRLVKEAQEVIEKQRNNKSAGDDLSGGK